MTGFAAAEERWRRGLGALRQVVRQELVAAEPPAGGVRAVEGDARELGSSFGPRSFDVVLCHGS